MSILDVASPLPLLAGALAAIKWESWRPPGSTEHGLSIAEALRADPSAAANLIDLCEALASAYLGMDYQAWEAGEGRTQQHVEFLLSRVGQPAAPPRGTIISLGWPPADPA